MGNSQTCCVSSRSIKSMTSAQTSAKSPTVSEQYGEPSERGIQNRTSATTTRPKSSTRASSTDMDRIHSPAIVSHTTTAAMYSDRRSANINESKTAAGDRRSVSQVSSHHSDSGKKVRGSVSEVSESRVASLFERYADPDEPELILACGVESLCRDLDLRPDEFRVLLLAWTMNTSEMCRITRSEFLTGCRFLHADAIRSISAKLANLSEEVARDEKLFRDVYRWAYRFALDKESLQSSLPVDTALAMWKIVFSGFRDASEKQLPSIVECWLEFLAVHPAIRAISRDTWDMFLTFVECVGDDLARYSDEEAWPSLLDEFVEHETDRRNQNLIEPVKEGTD